MFPGCCCGAGLQKNKGAIFAVEPPVWSSLCIYLRMDCEGQLKQTVFTGSICHRRVVNLPTRGSVEHRRPEHASLALSVFHL